MATEEFETICRDAVVAAATQLSRDVLTKAPDDLGVRFLVVVQTKNEDGQVNSALAASAPNTDTKKSEYLINEICRSILKRNKEGEVMSSGILDITNQVVTQ